MRLVLPTLVLVLIWASPRPAFPQALTLPSEAVLVPLQGFDRASGEPRGVCVDQQSTSHNATPVSSASHVMRVSDSADILQTQGISASAIYQGIGASGGLSYDALLSKQVHSYAETARARIIVRSGSRVWGARPNPAMAQLYADDYLTFLLKCGTHFVSLQTFGGAYEFIYSASGRTTLEQQAIRTAMNGAVQSGSRIDVSKFDDLKTATRHVEFWTDNRVRGLADAPAKSLEDQLVFAQSFEKRIHDSLAVIRASNASIEQADANSPAAEYTLTAYDQVYGAPTFAADYGALVNRWIELVQYESALDFINLHRDQFVPTSSRRIALASADSRAERDDIRALLLKCSNATAPCAPVAERVTIQLPQRAEAISINPQTTAPQILCSTVAGERKILRVSGSWIADPVQFPSATEHSVCDLSTPCVMTPAAEIRNLGPGIWHLGPSAVFSISIVDAAANDNVRGQEGFKALCGLPVFDADYGDDGLSLGSVGQPCRIPDGDVELAGADICRTR